MSDATREGPELAAFCLTHSVLGMTRDQLMETIWWFREARGRLARAGHAVCDALGTEDADDFFTTPAIDRAVSRFRAEAGPEGGGEA
jgi:hypothetical protein